MLLDCPERDVPWWTVAVPPVPEKNLEIPESNVKLPIIKPQMPGILGSNLDKLGIWDSMLGTLSFDLGISEILTVSTGDAAAAVDSAIRGVMSSYCDWKYVKYAKTGLA